MNIRVQAVSAELRRELEKVGFMVMAEGEQVIPPARGLIASLAECREFGAREFCIPHYATRGGEDLFLVFDTLVIHEGIIGKLSWHFSRDSRGVLKEESDAVGVFDGAVKNGSVTR